MAVYVSPGVYTREIDLSLYIPQISTTIFAIVGEFSKGETQTIQVNGDDYVVGKPTFVTSVLDFTRKFGNTNPDYLATYSALQYLRYGHQLIVVRVLGQNSVKAKTSVKTIHGATLTGTADAPFTFSSGNDTFKIALPAGKEGHSQIFTFEHREYTLQEVIDVINASAYHFKASASGTKLKLTATYDGSLKIGDGNANSVLGFTDDAEATPTEDTIDVYALSEGNWANGIYFKVSSGSLPDTFKITIYDKDGDILEVWDYLSYDKNSERYYTKLLASNYIADFVLDDDEMLVIGNDEYILRGGMLVPAQKEDFIQGLQQIRYPEDYDVNLIAVPGRYDHEIITEMLSICEERGDCMALIDPPFGYSIQDVVEWHNGKKEPNNTGVAYDSSYGALYYPWLEVYDYVNKQKVWTPPCGFVASMYAYTDLNYELWYAPAGFNRGRLVSALRLEVNPRQGDRDFLYGNGNAINPICSLPKHGITIYGQRTLQRMPTALDRVNVRRLLLYLRKVIATAVQGLLFEPNDAYTRRRFISLVKPFLEGVQARRGLQDFRIVCDETNNTPDVVERNEMIAYIFLKPTKVAEIIQVVFILTPQGAKFEEMVI